MDDDQDGCWGMVLSLTALDYGENTEHAYVHGFELGQIWQRMRSGREAEIRTTVHTINIPAFQRAAAADGWNIDTAPSDVEGWSTLKLAKVRAAMPNPNGLRVVQ